jgi:membrane protein implicated in regulation of membrane protease activity
VPDWLIWLIAAGVLAAAEVTSLTFVLIMLAGGAAAGAITAAAGGPVLAQVIVALVASAALLGIVRPIAQRQLRPREAHTGTDALVGMQAVVLREVGRDEGRVRLNGAEWSAHSYDPQIRLPAGAVVRVVEIQGATALVLADPSE